MPSKKLITAAVLVTILITASVVYACTTIGSNQTINRNNSLILKSFSATTYGDNITGGTLVIVNPTERVFENLTLCLRIDDSQLVTPFLQLQMPLPVDAPFGNYSVSLTKISIEAHQNISLKVFLYNPDQNEPPFYNTSVTAQICPHVIAFYLTQNSFGDIIDDQTFTVLQEKAHLQITNYSSVEHSSGTWHHIFNRSTNQYEYVNDNPNFYQQYYSSKFYPMTENSYNLAYMFNQLGEHYFNVTVCNNSTFPVNKISVNLGGSWTGYALPDRVLQPNETYVFPIVVAINESTDFVPLQSSASGDIVG